MNGQMDVTTGQLMDEAILEKFLTFLNVRPRSIAAYRYNIKAFFDYLSSQGIETPRREHVFAYRDFLIGTGKRHSTVRAYLIALRIFFRWSACEGLCDNIAEYVKFKKRDYEHRRDALTVRQVRGLLKKVDRSTLRGLRNYAILMVMVIGGLRCIEVSRAKVGDLVRRDGRTVLYVYGKGRDDSGADYVTLPHTVRCSIREYLRQRGGTERDAPLFAGMGNRHRDRPLSTRSISRIVKDALIDAGYNSDRLCAHSLRHTAVTLALMGGETLEAVKEFARHRSVNTTLVYSHALDRAHCTCTQTIERVLFGGRRRKKAKAASARA